MRATPYLLCLILVACGDDAAGPADAGRAVDASSPDGVLADATATDAPMSDAVPADAVLDAATADALVPDAAAGEVALAFSPSDHGFGLVELGASADVAITVRNSGSATIAITAVNIGGAGFSQRSTTCGGPLAPTASCAVSVRFAPTFVGVAAGAVVVTTDAGTASTGVAGTGAGRVTVARGGGGTGSIVSSPAGIACPGTCSALFGGPVTLTATADEGSRVVGWSAPCGLGETCALTPGDVPVTTTVRFELTASGTRQVSVVVAGTGLGGVEVSTPTTTMTCLDRCSYDVAVGSTVRVVGSTASIFAGWQGPCTGAGVCSFVVEDDVELTATFAPNPATAWLRTVSPEIRRIAFTADGDLLAASASQLTRLSGTGATRWTITLPVLAGARLLGVAADGAGNLYVLRRAASGTQRLDKLDLAGGSLWARDAPARDFSGALYESHLSVNSAGTAVVSGGLTVFEADGDVAWSKPGFVHSGVAIGPDGRVYAMVEADDPDNSRVAWFDAAGNPQPPAVDRLSGHLASIAINAAGVVATATSGHGDLTVATIGGTRYFVETAFSGGVETGVAVDGNDDMASVRNRSSSSQDGYLLRSDANRSTATWSFENINRGVEVRDFTADRVRRVAILAELTMEQASMSYVEVFEPPLP